MVEIREFTMQDYPAAHALWRESEGISLREADSPERIKYFLDRNPAMSFVAYDQDRLVGAALCGQDGRRGYLHHVAVARLSRRSGIGSALVFRCLEKLQTCGIQRCHLFVEQENSDAMAFWRGIGWFERSDLRMMSRDLGGLPHS
ncbi:MAG: GNAT family N-acetyltransferase [Acidobacteriia bacterium]|nr:GNAT family N-acetyltransferase [Terriglobia bacterium]